MSHDQNILPAMVDQNYSKIIVSEINGPITFGLGM